MDCDYNIHKSNSTVSLHASTRPTSKRLTLAQKYFADLDVSRAHALSAVIRTGLTRLNRGDQEGIPKSTSDVPGKYMVALGAVSCFFQRQIDPLAPFEIYTRVLSWDRKWIYLISHIVKKGAIKPDSYVLQPWKKTKRRSQAVKQEAEDLTKHIYATSISRYVFKKGRLTINPEQVLERSRLLPPRPAGTGLPPRTESSTTATPMSPPEGFTSNDLAGLESIAGALTARLDGVKEAAEEESGDSEEWTWDDMESERLRGLKLAAHFDALNEGHKELRAGEVLGKYGDYW